MRLDKNTASNHVKACSNEMKPGKSKSKFNWIKVENEVRLLVRQQLYITTEGVHIKGNEHV